MSQEAKRAGAVPPAEILSVGMATPVGLSAEASAAAIAAGRNQGWRTIAVNRASVGQAIHLVDEECLDPLNPSIESASLTDSHRRMLRLGGQVFAGCETQPPLMLALPEVPTKRNDSVGSSFTPQLAAHAGSMNLWGRSGRLLAKVLERGWQVAPILWFG